MTTTINTTTKEIIEILKPSEILVECSDYLQCIINDEFCEFQKDYVNKKWYKFKQTGKSFSPKEVFIKFI